jgi:hypothetical protein
MQSETIEFPAVAGVEGGITTDGQQMLVQLTTVDRGPIHFSLRLSDMESFVTFLLRTAANARATGTAEDRLRYQPIPISGVSAGELADGMGCLGVTIGGTELMFQIPVAAISQVAHTLMLVGTPDNKHRLS